MRRLRLALASTARGDVADIRNWLLQNAGRRAASRVTTQVYDALEHIRAWPQTGRLRPGHGAQLRSWPVGNYVVYYEATAHSVTVLRVLHAAQDREALLDRELGPSAAYKRSV